jgi:Ca2+/Na+ antiporter
MDARDWGHLIGATIVNTALFLICTLVAAMVISRSRLSPRKTALASLVVGHVVTSLLRISLGRGNPWEGIGVAISLVGGIPVLWIWITRSLSPKRPTSLAATEPPESEEQGPKRGS